MDRVNDFAFKIATANGTGSASANGLIMQAIFRMGVPVTGKNVFPSNIQGLPTWYEIRVSKHGYTARTPHFDLMVALNAATYAKDVAEVRAERLAALRLELAARRAAEAARRHLPRHPARRDVQRGVQGRARAHPDEEHRLCRRAGRAARHGHGGHPRAAQREVRRQAGADGLEPEGRRPRLQLREGALRVSAADPARADGRDEGLDPDRRQHVGGARVRLCRRDRRRLVSDHAVDVADGRVPRFLQEVPARPRDQEEPLLHPPGGRRAGGHRHGHRRGVGGCARVHVRRQGRASR